jgi:hypothetical protein
MKLLRKEIAILKKVNHDGNIVQFYGACSAEPAMLVMEYMEVRPKAGLTVTQICESRLCALLYAVTFWCGHRTTNNQACARSERQYGAGARFG